jgi:hypothetical protein
MPGKKWIIDRKIDFNQMKLFDDFVGIQLPQAS